MKAIGSFVKEEHTTPAVAATDEVVCTIYVSFKDAEQLQEPWDTFVEEVNGNLSATYDWCRVWWEHYGRNRSLRICVFKNDTGIVGIVPLCVDSFGAWPFRLKIAKLLGADSTMETVNPPLLEKYMGEIVRSVHKYTLGDLDCDAVCWGPLLGDKRAAKALDWYIKSYGAEYGIVKTLNHGWHTVFPLPQTFEQYLASLDKNMRQNFRRRMKQLSAKHCVAIEVVNATEHFDTFISLHESQWKAVGKLGHFGDWPGSREFHRELVYAHSRLDRVRMFCLLADDVPVAYRYVYRFGQRLFSILPARACAPQWNKYGLGQLVHILTAEKGIQEGAQEIDAGRGHYDYKLRSGGHEEPVATMVVSRSLLVSRIRVCLFCVLSHLLNLMYYKIWFCRVAAKLPFKRYPLWQLWIRSRL